MKRRQFIAAIGGAAAWPLTARAQQPAPLRRIGMLMNLAEGDAEAKRRIAAFLKTLGELGWSEGKNIHVDYRWGVDVQSVKENAAQLVALAPDAIVANAPPSVVAVRQLTQSVPVVFAAVTDPVALGVIESLARPGGNLTGFSPAEYDMGAKWLELLAEIAPGLKRVAVFADSSNPGATRQVVPIQAAASSLKVDMSLIGVSAAATIDRDVAEFARVPNGGLIVIRTSEDIAAREPIIAAAERFRLPAVYPLRLFVTGGGLLSYGPDIVEEYRGAAGYVDRILKGAKPADLPVQSSTKFELVVNLKSAKALGLAIPSTLLATADEVIE
ncbi:MAG: ABC transporter substrate-binding protein [Xanthobacteraceae bacterium]